MSTLGTLTAILQLRNAHFLKGIKESMDSIDGLTKKASTAGKVAGTIGAIGAAGLGTFVGASAIAVGAVTAVTKSLAQMATEAQSMPAVEAAFNGLATSFGSSGDAMLSALQKGSSGMISNLELMKSFNLGAQLVGQDFAVNLPSAFNYLGKVSASTGESMSYMLDSLVKGVGRLSPMILDNLGIQVSLTEAYENWADANGRTVESMTKAEQQAAVMAKTMELLAKNTASMPDITDLASTRLAQFQATLQNIKNELGVAFLPVLTEVAGAFGNLARDSIPALVPLVQLLGNVLLSLFRTLQPILGILGEFATALGEVAKAFMSGDIEGGTKLITEAINSLADNLGEFLPTFLTAGLNLVFGIVKGMANAIPALMPVTMSIVMSVVNVLAEALPQMLIMGLEIIMSLVMGLAEAAPLLIPVIINALVGMLIAIFDMLPDLILAGLQLVLGLVQGLMSAAPTLIQAVPVLISTLIVGIIENLPQILMMGVQLIFALLTGLIQAIPSLLSSGYKIIQMLTMGIIEAAPGIWEGLKSLWDYIVSFFGGVWDSLKSIGSKFVDSLVAGLLKGDWSGFDNIFTDAFANLPTLAESAANPTQIGVDTVLGIQTGLNTTMPNLLNSSASSMEELYRTMQTDTTPIGTEIITGIQDGANRGTPLLKRDLVEQMLSTTSALSNAAQTTSVTGAELITNMNAGWAGEFPAFDSSVLADMSTIPDMITSGTSAEITHTGTQLVENMQIGFNNTFPAFESEVQQAVKSILMLLAPLKDTLVYGVSMVEGVINGLYSKLPAALKAAVDVATQISNAFASAIEYGSPSKVFIRFGKSMMDGLAIGLEKAYPVVDRAMNDINAKSAFSFDSYETEPAQVTQNNYNLNANYGYESELSLIEQVNILNMLGSAT